MDSLKDRIKSNKRLKALAEFMLRPRNQYKPRWWIRALVNPFKHKKGPRSIIARRARKDLFPYNHFEIGSDSLVEDFSVLNNAVGEIIIGDRTLIGIGNIIIGPVHLGNDILLAQNVVLSGLNHGYENPELSIREQPVTTQTIIIEDAAWLGSNVVVTAGTRIGKHAIVAAGSIVTKDVAPYTMVAGNPARLLKRYNFDTKEWERVKHVSMKK